jgi:hypothetical protein
MLYAVRGNKQLKIDEASHQRYLNLGYDIAKEVDGKLEIVQHAPNKTVSYAQYEALLKENAKLKEQIEELKKQQEASAPEGNKGKPAGEVKQEDEAATEGKQKGNKK